MHADARRFNHLSACICVHLRSKNLALSGASVCAAVQSHHFLPSRCGRSPLANSVIKMKTDKANTRFAPSPCRRNQVFRHVRSAAPATWLKMPATWLTMIVSPAAWHGIRRGRRPAPFHCQRRGPGQGRLEPTAVVAARYQQITLQEPLIMTGEALAMTATAWPMLSLSY
jgi:hypothetical protein